MGGEKRLAICVLQDGRRREREIAQNGLELTSFQNGCDCDDAEVLTVICSALCGTSRLLSHWETATDHWLRGLWKMAHLGLKVVPPNPVIFSSEREGRWRGDERH